MKLKRPELLFALVLIASAIAGCGSAEAIRVYRYPTTKDNLEMAVKKVIKSNPHIYLDTTQRQVRLKRIPNDNSDTTTYIVNISDYYGEDRGQLLAYFNSLVRIKIRVGQTANNYEFSYYGGEQDWKSSRTSAILVSEARDKYGNSLSQGHNEHGEFKTKLARDFTEVFETEFVSRLDKELNLKHSVE